MIRSRMKPYRRAAPTAAERRHLDRVAEMPCLICGSASTVHHVTSDGYQRLTRVHSRIVPLCPAHHMIQFGPKGSVEALGHAGFTAIYGVDLDEVAQQLWRESVALEAARSSPRPRSSAPATINHDGAFVAGAVATSGR